MAKEALVQVKDLTKEELRDKIRSGEVTPPKKGPERDEFFKFIDMSKEQRETYLTGTEPPKSPEEPPKEPQKEDPPKPAESLKEPWWKEMGYEDDEKAKEAHKNLLDLTTRLQTTVDKLNASEGRRGNELKRLSEERAALEKEIEELRKSSAPKIEKPTKPVRPKVADYENGALDEKYIADKEKYDEDMEVYLEKNAEYIRAETKREILETVPKPQKVVEAPKTDETAWNKFFDKDIPEFQKRFNLVTTVPVRQISDSYNIADPNSKATPQERATAQAFLKSVPKADLDVYAKVKTAVEVAYDFDSGTPQSRYKSIEGALFDNGLIGEGKPFNVVKPVQLSEEEERSAREQARQKNDKVESTIPSSSLAGGDPKLSDSQNPEEEKRKYKDLLGLYNVALNSGKDAQTRFEQSQEYAEMLTLRKKIFGKLPSYLG